MLKKISFSKSQSFKMLKKITFEGSTSKVSQMQKSKVKESEKNVQLPPVENAA